jgi:hypothetical protein
MLADLSFSTYEASPEGTSARIVGVCGAPLVNGRPRSDYRLPRLLASDIIINTIEATLSPQAFDRYAEQYAEFAATSLTNDQRRSEIEEFVSLAEKIRISDLGQLVDEYRQFAGPVNPRELTPLAMRMNLHPSRAPSYLTRPSFRQGVIASVQSPNWGLDGPTIFVQLRNQSRSDRSLASKLQLLVDEACDAIIQQLTDGMHSQADRILSQVVRPILGEVEAYNVFAPTLLQLIKDATDNARAIRRFVLHLALGARVLPSEPRLSNMFEGPVKDWFDVLGETDLPADWQSVVILTILRTSSPSDDPIVAKLATRYPEQLREQLLELIRNEEGNLVLKILRAYLAENRRREVGYLIERVVETGRDGVTKTVADELVEWTMKDRATHAVTGIIGEVQDQAFAHLLDRQQFNGLVSSFLSEVDLELAGTTMEVKWRPYPYRYLTKIRLITSSPRIPESLAKRAQILLDRASVFQGRAAGGVDLSQSKTVMIPSTPPIRGEALEEVGIEEVLRELNEAIRRNPLGAGDIARQTMAKLEDTPGNALVAVLSRPDAAAIVHIMICAPFLTSEGIIVFRRLRPQDPGSFKNVLLGYRRMFNHNPKLEDAFNRRTEVALESLKIAFGRDTETKQVIDRFLNLCMRLQRQRWGP